jgi:hypothetical protein
MAKPQKYDMDLYRGDSAGWSFALWGDEAHTEPLILTDVVAEAEFRDKSAGSSVVTFACTIIGNSVEVRLPATAWTGAPPGGGWDLQLTFADGSVRTVVAGRVVVTPDITDSTPAGLFAERQIRAVS